MTTLSTLLTGCLAVVCALAIGPARAAPDPACEALVQRIAKDVGGEPDGTKITHPLADIGVACVSDEMASVDLWGSGDGIPPALLDLVARVGAAAARLPAGGLRGEPARCLKTVTGFYKMGKVGRHHKPSPDMPLTYEGTLTTPHATIQCSYVGKEKRKVHFWVGGR